MSSNNEELEDDLFADESLADQEWMARYEEERKVNEELEREVRDCLQSTKSVSEW